MLKELDFENPDSDVLLLKYHFQDSILRRKSRIRIKFWLKYLFAQNPIILSWRYNFFLLKY